MFIESLEFTIPVDLCNLCSTLQKGIQSDLEFPASVNSYGTTQDASIQVLLKANKLTFKVDGVSSDASIITKSESRTLKLSVFDVDRSLIPQACQDNLNSNNVSHSYHIHSSTPTSNSSKRPHDFSPSTPIQSKVMRHSQSHESERKTTKSPVHLNSKECRPSVSKTSNDIVVKTEPEDPDLIEIDPDPEPIKTEDVPSESYSNDYSQTMPSSYERNVPHVPDYAEPSTSRSRNHGNNQSGDDFLVFQDDSYADDDNDVDYSNDDLSASSESRHASQGSDPSCSVAQIYNDYTQPKSATMKATVWTVKLLKSGVGEGFSNPLSLLSSGSFASQGQIPQGHHNLPYMRLHNDQVLVRSSSLRVPPKKNFPCPQCDKAFSDPCALNYHKEAIHDRITFQCVCGKSYKYRPGLLGHRKSCVHYLTQQQLEKEAFARR